MRPLLKSVFMPLRKDTSDIRKINSLRLEYCPKEEDNLGRLAQSTENLCESFAITAVVAARILGQEMFDVQLRGALALTRGSIAEMQTGEGKTLAAVPAVAWYAKDKQGVHVLTANDYLARRDAEWMGRIYRRLGFTVGYFQQGMSAEARRRAYGCDITYATANEIGFDFLRDQLAFDLGAQVLRRGLPLLLLMKLTPSRLMKRAFPW